MIGIQVFRYIQLSDPSRIPATQTWVSGLLLSAALHKWTLKVQPFTSDPAFHFLDPVPSNLFVVFFDLIIFFSFRQIWFDFCLFSHFSSAEQSLPTVAEKNPRSPRCSCVEPPTLTLLPLGFRETLPSARLVGCWVNIQVPRYSVHAGRSAGIGIGNQFTVSALNSFFFFFLFFWWDLHMWREKSAGA